MRLYLNFIARELVTFLKDDELNTATKTTRIYCISCNTKHKNYFKNLCEILKNKI